MAAEMATANALSQLLNSAGDLGDRDALDACVCKITQRIDELKGQVYEAVKNHYKEFIYTINYSVDLNAEVDALASDLDAVKTKIKTGNLAKLVSSVTEQKALASQLKTTTATISTLQTLCKIDERLSNFDNLCEQGDLHGAAASIQEVDKLMAEISPEGEGACDVKIYTVIRNELRLKKSQLKSHLDELWRRAVAWQQSDGETGVKTALQISSFVDPATSTNGEVSLNTILETMGTLDMLTQKFAAFAANMLKLVVTPLATNMALQPNVKLSPKSATLTLVPAAAEESSAASKRSKVKRGKKGGVDPSVVFERVLEVIDFVLSRIVPDKRVDNPYVQLLGSSLYPSLSALLIEEVLAKAVPSQESTLDSHKPVAESTRAFEERLVTLGLVTEDAKELVTYVGNVPIHHSNKKRQEILNQARELMICNNFNTVEVEHQTEKGGLFPAQASSELTAEDLTLGESVYALPKCHISVATQSLVDLAYRTLEDMSSAAPEAAVQLFYSVRDIFDLFRAVVPTCHKESLENIPHAAVVFHNDCFYIAHHLLSLGHQFRKQLPEDLAKIATFIDMVPIFHDLGERHFQSMMEKQQEALLASLASCKGFGGTQEDDRFNTVQRAINQVLHQLSILSKVCKEIMPTSLYNISMGALVQCVVKKIVGSILALEDISEEETHQLHQLLDLLALRVPTFWGEQDPSSPQLCEYIPSWRKYTQVMEVLKASLVSISERWAQHYWAFDASELRGLVSALFTNSDRRARFLESLH